MKIASNLDFQGVSKIINLPNPINNGDAVSKSYLTQQLGGFVSGQVVFGGSATSLSSNNNFVFDSTLNVLKLQDGSVSQPSYAFIGSPTTGISYNSTTQTLRLHAGTNRKFEFVRSSDGLTKTMSLNNVPFSSFTFEESVWVGGGGNGGAIAFGISSVSDCQLARVGTGKLNFQGSASQTNLTSLGVNNANPAAQLDIVNLTLNQPVLRLQAANSQTSNLVEFRDNVGQINFYFNPFLPANSTFLKYTFPINAINSYGTLWNITTGTRTLLELKQGMSTSPAPTNPNGIVDFNLYSGSGLYSAGIQVNENNVTFGSANGGVTFFNINHLQPSMIKIPGELEVGSNTSSSNSQSAVFTPRSNNIKGVVIKAFSASQSANLMEIQNSSGSVVSIQAKADGSMKPAFLNDANATNDSIYFSIDKNRLVYKDIGGTIRNLY